MSKKKELCLYCQRKYHNCPVDGGCKDSLRVTIKELEARIKELEEYKTRLDWLLCRVGVNQNSVFMPTCSGKLRDKDKIWSIKCIDKALSNE